MEPQLVKKYKSLNKSFDNKLTFHLGAEAGFFSEINNMILAMIYCLDNRIKFTLYSKRGNFSLINGWIDFFLPFCDQTEFYLHKRYNRRANQVKNSKKLPPKFLKLITGNEYLTQDIWNSFRNSRFSNKQFSIPELGIKDASLLQVTRTIIPMIWRYQPDSEKIIEKYKSSIELPPDYISIHIRFGDKNIESNTYSIQKYIEKASLVNFSKNAFILTDDYKVIEELEKNYPDWNFRTLCSPTEKGYRHSDFKKYDNHEKYLQHLKLLASIDLCAESKHFIGTYSSNPGMFLGMRIGEENCSCLDFDNWVLW